MEQPSLKFTVRFLLGLVLVLLLPGPAFGREGFPALTGRVVDEADLFKPAEEEELTRVLAEFEAATTNQFVVVTLRTLGGADIKQYAAELGHYWGIGQKGKDNGAVLLIAVEDRKVAIQVGYGLEEKLTDGTCGEIIRETIIPFFKEGDYYNGVRAGLAAMMARVAPEFQPGFDLPSSLPEEREEVPRALMILLFLLFIFVAFSASTAQSRRYWRRRGFSTGGGFFGGGWFGGGGFGGGGFGGGGGFRGGGGGFGGGGASGSW
ncbi:MAG: TPM domain-containing protein [Bacillota bacterium]